MLRCNLILSLTPSTAIYSVLGTRLVKARCLHVQSSLRFVHTIDFQQMVLAAHNNVSRELVQKKNVASKHGATMTAPRASAILASPSTGHRIDNFSTFAPDIMPVAAMRSQELASQLFAILNIFFCRIICVLK